MNRIYCLLCLTPQFVVILFNSIVLLCCCCYCCCCFCYLVDSSTTHRFQEPTNGVIVYILIFCLVQPFFPIPLFLNFWFVIWLAVVCTHSLTHTNTHTFRFTQVFNTNIRKKFLKPLSSHRITLLVCFYHHFFIHSFTKSHWYILYNFHDDEPFLFVFLFCFVQAQSKKN